MFYNITATLKKLCAFGGLNSDSFNTINTI